MHKMTFVLLVLASNLIYSKAEQKRIAICFYGLPRSVQYTYKNIEKKILAPLKDCDVTVFCHALKLTHSYSNPRNGEFDINLDPNQIYLLKYNYLVEEDQDEVDKILHLDNYKTQRDPYKNDYLSVDNLIRSLYSLYAVTKMLNNSDKHFDMVMFIRHDLKYNSSISKAIKILSKNPDNLLVPDFHSVNGYNDRFSIGNLENCLTYGNRFTGLLKYSRKYPLIAQKYLKYWLDHKKIKTNKIKFFFSRIRANGAMVQEKFHVK